MSKYIALVELGYSDRERIRFFKLFERLELAPKKVIVNMKENFYRKSYLCNGYSLEQIVIALEYYKILFNETKNFLYKQCISGCIELRDKMTIYLKENK